LSSPYCKICFLLRFRKIGTKALSYDGFTRESDLGVTTPKAPILLSRSTLLPRMAMHIKE
jgi:hypothetical protein